MKRYSALMAMTLIIVLVIGSFYIQKGSAKGNLPEIEWETISGNEELVQSLTILADISIGGQYERVNITKDDAIFHSERSFIARNINNVYQSPEIKRLQSEYRSFMRGKMEGEEFFYDGNNYLAYANIRSTYLYDRQEDFTFDLGLLNKETGEKTKKEIEVPNKTDFQYMYVVDVQVANNQLKVVTRNRTVDSVGTYLYTFDINTLELINHEVLKEVSDEGNEQWTELAIVNNEYDLSPSQFLVLKKEFIEQEESDSNTKNGNYEAEQEVYKPNEEKSVYYSFDYETNEMKELSMPSEFRQMMPIGSLYVKDDEIIIKTMEESSLRVMSYNLQEESIAINQTFDLNQTEENHPFTQIMDGMLYVLTATENSKETSLTIFDLKSADVLYEGKLVLSGDSEYQLFGSLMMME